MGENGTECSSREQPQEEARSRTGPTEETPVAKNKWWYQTRDLLRSYRSLRRHRDQAVWENVGLPGEDYSREVLVRFMTDRTSSGVVLIKSIARSAEVTRTLLQHVDQMLSEFEKDCRKSREPAVRGQLWILKHCYLMRNQYTMQEIALQLHISVKTAYRWHDMGISRLSVYVFGADAIGIPDRPEEKPDPA